MWSKVVGDVSRNLIELLTRRGANGGTRTALAVLREAVDERGVVTDDDRKVAAQLSGLPEAAVYGVSTYYDDLTPHGIARLFVMCRNIHTLYNFEPEATDEEIRDASLQYVRKISGFTMPSQANAEAFERAVDDVAAVSARLLGELVTTAPPKDRGAEAAKKRARWLERQAV